MTENEDKNILRYILFATILIDFMQLLIVTNCSILYMKWTIIINLLISLLLVICMYRASRLTLWHLFLWSKHWRFLWKRWQVEWCRTSRWWGDSARERIQRAWRSCWRSHYWSCLSETWRRPDSSAPRSAEKESVIRHKFISMFFTNLISPNTDQNTVYRIKPALSSFIYYLRLKIKIYIELYMFITLSTLSFLYCISI